MNLVISLIKLIVYDLFIDRLKTNINILYLNKALNFFYFQLSEFL